MLQHINSPRHDSSALFADRGVVVCHLELGHQGVIGKDALTAAHKELRYGCKYLDEGLWSLQLCVGWIYGSLICLWDAASCRNTARLVVTRQNWHVLN